ncbi:MAG: hypothetical protein IPP91_03480 [Betaproteobacteria bacterium]|nr:hypothetical protein [Betaproteobacteria bacterium]
MKRTLLFLVLGFACAGVGAVEIKAYDTRLEVALDGAAQAVVDLQVDGAQAGRFKLPVGFGAIEEFKPLDVPAGVVLKPLTTKEQSSVEIELPDGVSAAVNIGFSFRVPGVLFVPKPEAGQKSALPKGSRLLRHSFVNTQPAPISRYTMQVRLPEETMVQKIREQLPKARRKEFTPRVELDRYDGRQGALLQLAGIKQGDRTSMELEVVGDRRSLGWLLVGLVLAAGYLVGFRDLVKTGGG